MLQNKLILDKPYYKRKLVITILVVNKLSRLINKVISTIREFLIKVVLETRGLKSLQLENKILIILEK